MLQGMVIGEHDHDLNAIETVSDLLSSDVRVREPCDAIPMMQLVSLTADSGCDLQALQLSMYMT